MRIGFVTNEFVTEASCFDGGLANYLYRVALALKEMGHEPVILVASDRQEILAYNHIEVHRVAVVNPGFPISVFWLYQSYMLNEYIRERHCSMPFDVLQYTSYTATALYRVETIPSVVRISSYNPLLMRYYNFPFEQDIEYQNTLEMLALHHVDRVFGPSRIIADIIQEREGLPVELIESPFVYDVDRKDPKIVENELAGKRYLLFLGTLGILKGILTIAEMIQELLTTYPELYFVFVGKVTAYQGKSISEYLREKAGDAHPRILHFQPMPHAQLYPIIEQAEAVVLPSRIDNFPNTCIEAMAHGKIVIGTRETGFDQLITDGVNGFLCFKDQPEELFRTIEVVLRLPLDQKRRIEQQARQRVEALRPEKVVTQLIAFYKHVIQEFQPNTATSIDVVHKISQIYVYGLQTFAQQPQLLQKELHVLKHTLKKKEKQLHGIRHSRAYRFMMSLKQCLHFFKNTHVML